MVLHIIFAVIDLIANKLTFLENKSCVTNIYLYPNCVTGRGPNTSMLTISLVLVGNLKSCLTSECLVFFF